MKKITKYLLCLTLVCTFCFTLVGCSKEDTSDTNQSNQTDQTNDTNNNTTDNDLEKIDKEITNKFNNDYEINKTDVSEAVTYINENLDNVKDKETAKNYMNMQVIYKWLQIKDKLEMKIQLEIQLIKLKYAKEVYNANDDELDDIINGAKYDFDEFRTQLGDDINNAVDNFMGFFETNKDNEIIVRIIVRLFV